MKTQIQTGSEGNVFTEDAGIFFSFFFFRSGRKIWLDCFQGWEELQSMSGLVRSACSSPWSSDLCLSRFEALLLDYRIDRMPIRVSMH